MVVGIFSFHALGQRYCIILYCRAISSALWFSNIAVHDYNYTYFHQTTVENLKQQLMRISWIAISDRYSLAPFKSISNHYHRLFENDGTKMPQNLFMRYMSANLLSPGTWWLVRRTVSVLKYLQRLWQVDYERVNQPYEQLTSEYKNDGVCNT